MKIPVHGAGPRVLALALCALVGCDSPSAIDRGLLNLEVELTQEQLGDLYGSTGSGAELSVRVGLDDERFAAKVQVTGASSLFALKRGLNIDLEDGVFRGMRSFRLTSAQADPSMLRIPLAFEVFARQGVLTPEVMAAAVSFNTRYFGLYYLVERVDSDFFSRRGLRVSSLYSAAELASFTGGMDARLSEAFEVRLGPETLVELARLDQLVETAGRDEFEVQIFSMIDRQDTVAYLTAALLTDHGDGFNRNLFYFSPSFGAPFRFVPWDTDRTWNRIVGTTTGRVWKDNALFERMYAIAGVREEILRRLGEASAGDESPAPFGERLQSRRQEIARAYADDPVLGHLELEKESADLQAAYSDWLDLLQNQVDGNLLGAREPP